MFYKIKCFLKYTLLYGILCLLNLVSDYILNSRHDKVSYFKAITDNLTHGMNALITWLMICVLDKNVDNFAWKGAFLSAILACLIDSDHFAAVKSLKLEV